MLLLLLLVLCFEDTWGVMRVEVASHSVSVCDESVSSTLSKHDEDVLPYALAATML